MTDKKTSIYSIAQEAGVSVSTVSRALNGNERIGTDTIERIRRIADQLGYKLPPLEKRRGKRPKNGTMRELSLVFYTESWMSQELIEGMNSALSQVGQRISVTSNANGDDPLPLISGTKQLDGIIFLGYPEKLIASGILNQVPGVQVIGHRSIKDRSFSRVSYNHNTVAELAVDYLSRRGLDDFGFYYQSGVYAAEERRALFRMNAEFNDAKVTDFGFAVSQDGYSQIPGERLKDFFQNDHKPCGFFAYNDMLAVYLQMQLLSLGLTPEKDFYIVTCIGNQDRMGVLSPKPGRILIDFHKIGMTAAKSLIKRITKPKSEPQTIMTEPRLINN